MAEIIYQMNNDGIDWVALKDILVKDNFDNGRTPEQYRISAENTAVVCYAKVGDQIIGTVRALSDGVCNAYIVDVWTYTPYRKQGVASEMMRRVMAELQGQHVYLFTDDSQGFYQTLGFEEQPTGMGLVVGEWLKKA